MRRKEISRWPSTWHMFTMSGIFSWIDRAMSAKIRLTPAMATQKSREWHGVAMVIVDRASGGEHSMRRMMTGLHSPKVRVFRSIT